jgi:hypothetical protein
MKITVVQGRAVFPECDDDTDRDESGKAGIKAYNWVVGFFRCLFGHAVKLQNDEKRTFYVEN